MGEQFRAETVNDLNFRFFSVAALIKKVKRGIGTEELYREAERKFDTLIELLSDSDIDRALIAGIGYSLDELKEISLLIFNRIISHTSTNPYITLCVSEEASLEEIKRRRNKLLYIFHPDRNPNELTNKTNTMKINEAYSLISNKYYKAGDQFRYVKTRGPRYHSSRKKKTFMFFIILIMFILIFWMVIKSCNLF
ncbi:MAG: J domain-containing protein [Nitrospirae bacterium]|nr:J domain-containing protein [Nitrospirota bacterium]